MDTAFDRRSPSSIGMSLLSRPQLDRRLEGALARPLTTVVGEAGFGKSTALAAWSQKHSSIWYTASGVDRSLVTFARGLIDVLTNVVLGFPKTLSQTLGGQRGPIAESDERARGEVFGSVLCDHLSRNLREDLVLIFDDVHELEPTDGGAKVIEALCRQGPPLLHVVLSSRADPPFEIERLRAQGQVLEIVGSELLFSLEETRSLVAMSIEDAETMAADVHDSTGGWPAGVRLTVEALRKFPPEQRRRRIRTFHRPGGPLFTFLAQEVFDREPPSVQGLIRTVASLDLFTAELCAYLGVRDAASTISSLERRGLFIESDANNPEWFSLSALANQFVRDYLAIPEDEASRINKAAIAWFETNGHLEQALHCMISVGDKAELAAFIKNHAPTLLLAGQAEAVAKAFRSLPAELADDRIRELAGEALLICGDWEAALTCYECCGPDPSSSVAWRRGLIHYLRGELDQALDSFASVTLGDQPNRDDALVLAWAASVHWVRGDIEACSQTGIRALEVAYSLNDDQALAAAHVSNALLAALEGDRAANDHHYQQALVHAERAGDVLQMLRIHTNRGSFYMEEGYYEESLDETDHALRLADLVDYSAYRAMCLTNRGEARFHLGQLDEAIADLDSAKALYQRIGSKNVSYALEKMGHVYRERGDLALAHAAYEEAIRQAESSGDLQGLVPSLAGLARVLIEDDPERAQQLANRAVSYGAGMGHVDALNSSAAVALSRGDVAGAKQSADEAARVARRRRDRAGIAEALEIKALASAGDSALELLREAGAIWRDLKNPIAKARTDITMARLRPSSESLSAARRAERSMKSMGARRYLVTTSALGSTATGPSLEIQTLGVFSITREGSPVHNSEWHSRKARDLLKILIARRGHPASRDLLNSWLWPDESDPLRLSNRCSVALATVRSVLDPTKRHDPNYFVVAGRESIRLDLAHIDIDVETFIKGATAGLMPPNPHDPSLSVRHLAAAESLYAGDFLEQDAYVDWAVPLREEARDLYIRVARALATEAIRSGDPNAAQRFLLRILERDTFDEQAHLQLISALSASGRHGEARRAYRAYCSRMKEIAVEAAPFPGSGLERAEP